VIIVSLIFLIFCGVTGYLFYESNPRTSGWNLGIGFCTLIDLIARLIN